MPWYFYEPEKKPPFVAVDPGDDWKPLASVMAWGIGSLAVLASVVGIFVKGWAISGWSLALAFASFAVARLLLRSGR